MIALRVLSTIARRLSLSATQRLLILLLSLVLALSIVVLPAQPRTQVAWQQRTQTSQTTSTVTFCTGALERRAVQ